MDDQTTGPADLPDDASRRRASPADGGSMSRRRVVVICATSLSVLAVAGTVGLWAVYNRLNDNIRTVDIHADGAPGPADALRPQSSTPPTGDRASMNVLLIGSDDRDGSNAQYGDAELRGPLGHHDAAARGRGPEERDGRLDPARHDGADAGLRASPTARSPSRSSAMFNAAFSIGGAACTVKTVEAFSGLTVDHVLVVDFTGFKKIVDAIGGVPVHLDQAVNDPDSHLYLPAGTTVVNGEQALAFVRARHSLGNGSDIGRMSRQQEFLNSALDTLATNGTLDDPAKLYKVLDAATKALTTDPALGSLPALADFASDLKQVPRQQITYLTVPWQWYQPDPNRVQLAPMAQELFTAMRQDTPVPADVLALSAKQGEQTTP